MPKSRQTNSLFDILPTVRIADYNPPSQFVSAKLLGADGSLLQRRYIKNGSEVSKTDYLRGKEMKNGVMESVYHTDGRVVKSGGTWQYEYWLKDHLGNTREVFTDVNGDGVIGLAERKGQMDYYNFGMEWNGMCSRQESTMPENKYRYNAKEKWEEMDLGLYHYGARMMDPVLGRFRRVDPLASKYPSWSPYNYTMNNPIRFTDPTGMEVEGDIYNKKGEHIGNDGKADQKVYVLDTYSSTKLDKELSQKVIEKGYSGRAELTEVNITNDELNARATLSTLMQTEAGRSNPPLDYNSWFGTGNTFTEDSYASNPEAYSKHPGMHDDPKGSAAGAYQFLERFYTGSDFSPSSQDQAALSLMGKKGLPHAKSGDILSFKSNMSGKWTSLAHWKDSKLTAEFNKNRASELFGNSRVGTPVGSLFIKK